MGIGHFVFHQVLAVHDDQLGVAEVIEVALAVLQAMHPRMTGRLIAVPSVIRPDATTLGFLRLYPTNMDIQQREGIAQPIHAVFPEHAEQTHTAARLDGARARAAHVLDHLLWIALCFEQLRPRLAAVARGDGLHTLGDVAEGVVPRDALELVRAARIELVAGFHLVGELREAVVSPAFPAAAHDGMLQPIRSVENAMERVALRAMTVAPVGGGVVAVKVRVGVDVVLFAETDDDAIANVRSDAAVVRVVRRADPRELMIVGVLIPVKLLPIAVGVMGERIGDVLGGLGLQKAQRQELRGGDARTDKAAALEERAAGKGVVQRVVHGEFSVEPSLLSRHRRPVETSC